MSSQSERAQRARDGSKRKRDQQALRDERYSRPSDINRDPAAAGAWSAMLEAIRGSLPESCYLHWLAPVVAIGSREGKLCLESPRRLGWYEERYGNTLDELAALNGYNGWAIYAGRGGPIA